jgi:hypothetical protein
MSERIDISYYVPCDINFKECVAFHFLKIFFKS